MEPVDQGAVDPLRRLLLGLPSGPGADHLVELRVAVEDREHLRRQRPLVADDVAVPVQTRISTSPTLRAFCPPSRIGTTRGGMPRTGPAVSPLTETPVLGSMPK